MENTFLDYEGLKHLIKTQEAADVDDNTYLKQYATMPEAGEDLLDEIAQYIGATTSDYKNGYFYKCVSDGKTTPTYSWVEVIGAGEKEVVHVDTLPVAPNIEDKVYETYGKSEHVVMTVPEVADFETYFSQFEFFNVSADAADVKEGYKVVAYDVAARIPNYGNWAITIDPSPSSSDHPYIIYFVSSSGTITQDKTAMVGHTLSLDVVDESVVDVYVGDATNQTLIPISGSSVEVDNDTILKDANDIISVSPNFKATFKGTKAQWRALTAEQKAVFANGFVNITDDYEEGGSGGGATTSDEIWVSRTAPVIQVPYESTYHYSRVYFSAIAGGRYDWTIKPNGTEIFCVCLPRNSGKLISHRVRLDVKNLSTGVWSGTSDGLLDELVPPSSNSRYGDYSGYIVLKNHKEYEYALRLTMVGNNTGYPTEDNIMLVLRRCILSEDNKATYGEAILADTRVLSASVEIGS